MSRIIHSSAPAAVEKPSTFIPPTPEAKAAMRGYVLKIVQERIDAGLYPDGRVADMAKYSRYLDSQKDA